MDKPLVSFIVTYHNEPAEMIEQCLDSILALSLSDKEREIVMVDDGSDTNIFMALAAYHDKLTYIHQPNQGLSVARNTGLKIASGTYIQFVDADDYLLITAYEHTLDLARYHNPDIVLFRFTHKHESETPFVLPTPVTGAEYMRHNNLRASAWGYIFRRSVLGDLRFTPGILHEDEEFTPQLVLRCERVFSTDDKCYFYRERENSIISNNDTKHILHRLNDTENVIYHLFEKKETLPIGDQPALQRRIDQLTMDYLYITMGLTRSMREVESRIKRLEAKGLFPLPDKGYTKKYSAFRKMIASKMGRRIMLATIALKQKL